MPTIRDSQRVQAPVAAPVMGRTEGTLAPPTMPAPPAAPIATPAAPVYRTSPLPIFASGTDRDGRQWARPGFPQRRFLPIGLGGSL